MKTATSSDFKKGTVLTTSEGYSFTLVSEYSEGVWEAKGNQGQGYKCIYVSEAKFYTTNA